MNDVLDAFWRAAAYCLHPRVIGLSLLPLLICGVLSWLGWWLYWDTAVAAVQGGLPSWPLVGTLVQWAERWAGEGVRGVLAPAIVVGLSMPVVVVVSVLLVGLLMTPAIVSLVEQRRFPQLQRRHGAGVVSSVWVSLSSTLVALVLLLLSLPLWLVPPLILVLPPLIWGWLTYRVFGFDVLAEHASADERRALLKAHRIPMMTMGVICGYLGAVPSLIWAIAGVTGFIFAPFLVLVAVWLYTLVFAFSTAWFTHYALAALQAWRAAEPVVEAEIVLARDGLS